MASRFRLSLSLALISSACAHGKIQNTQIDDTPDNRQIVALVEQYHQAMERLDSEAVLALVSTEYYEDNGNTDSNDDYDYNGLRESLQQDFARTKTMRLEIRIDSVQVEENEAYAEFYYQFYAHNEYPAGLRWDTGSDRTRLRMARNEGGNWLIVGGL